MTAQNISVICLKVVVVEPAALRDRVQFTLRSSGGGGQGWRVARLVTIVELIDPRPYMFSICRVRRMIYMYMSDRPINSSNPNPHLPPPELTAE
jgi:hypothetical protein